MGFCGCNTQVVVLLSTIYVIIQSFVHLGLTIFQFTLYYMDCESVLTRSVFGEMLLSVPYFCGNPDQIADRNWILNRSITLAIIYIVLDALWILISLTLAIWTCATKDNGLKLWIFILWDIVAVAQIMMDVASTVIYSIDISKPEMFQKSKINNLIIDKFITDYFIVKLLISCRVVVFLLGNIMSAISMMMVTHQHTNKNSVSRRKIPLKSALSPSISKKRGHNYTNKNYQNDEYDNDDDSCGEDDTVYPAVYLPGSSNNYNNQSQPANMYQDSKHPPQATPMVGSNTNVLVNGVPSGTLRRQLPWSYFQAPNTKAHKQVRNEAMDLPPVPAPDYTVRLKNAYPVTQSDMDIPVNHIPRVALGKLGMKYPKPTPPPIPVRPRNDDLWRSHAQSPIAQSNNYRRY